MAAEEAGIPLTEAIAWLAEKESAAAQDEMAARILGAEMIEAAMDTLKRIAAGEPRISSQSVSTGSGVSEATSWRPDDLTASKALLEAGLKLLKARRRVEADQKASGSDLFDAAPSNWTFKAR